MNEKQKHTYDAFIGLDVHKETIAAAIASPERGGEVRFYGNINNEPAAQAVSNRWNYDSFKSLVAWLAVYRCNMNQ